MKAPMPTVRRAHAGDQTAIEALVRGEHLNPNGLDWWRFRVAVAGARVVGAVQMRAHRDGSRELGSLVVAREYRGRGLAAQLIEALLADHTGEVHLVTARGNASHYRRWGFRAVGALRAPRAVRRNWCLGQLIGGAVALANGRTPRRMVILGRA
jgi:amino-acid N-acetyltransferase